MAKPIFLSYQKDSNPEVVRLSQLLGYRGVSSWVDKLPQGFHPGDDSQDEARRIIREESSAFFLYLTEKVWGSYFIKDIELPEADARRHRDELYKVIVASPTYGFGEMKSLSKERLGIDLSQPHGFVLSDSEDQDEFLGRLSNELLRHHTRLVPSNRGHLNISMNTYDAMPDLDEDFYFDAVEEIRSGVGKPEVWKALYEGVLRTKIGISASIGRPRIRVHGSKHLTAAFLLGNIFNQFDMVIRQRNDFWATDGQIIEDTGLNVNYIPGPLRQSSLFVEFSTGVKPVSLGVDQLLESANLVAGARLKLRPRNGRINVDEIISRSLAHQVYAAIDEACSNRQTDSIHLFFAAPQATVLTLATLFQGMPRVHLYEWTEAGYIETLVIPGRT